MNLAAEIKQAYRKGDILFRLIFVNIAVFVLARTGIRILPAVYTRDHDYRTSHSLFRLCAEIPDGSQQAG